MNDFYNLQTPSQQTPQGQEKSLKSGVKQSVMTKLAQLGNIPFQYNGQTYYLSYGFDSKPRVFSKTDPLGITQQDYAFDGRTKNRPLELAALAKIESMYSNPYVQRTPVQPSQQQPQSTPTLVQVPTQRQIDQYPSYQEEYVIRVPVPRQQQVAPPAPAESMSFSGPSEQQLLNTFYKRVLLNTVS